MDLQEQQAREATKGLRGKEKWENFWYYKKGIIIAAVIILAVVLFTVWQINQIQVVDLKVNYFANGYIEEEVVQNMQKYFSNFVSEVNFDGICDVKVTPVATTYEAGEESAYIEKFAAEINSGEAMAYIVDDAYLEVLKADSFEGVVQEIYDMGENPELKEKLGFRNEHLYFVVKSLYDREKNDSKKAKMHENAEAVYAAVSSGTVYEEPEEPVETTAAE